MPDPRIKLNALASLCRRVAVSLGAGLNMRTVWVSESQRRWKTAAVKQQFQRISEAVQAGQSLSDAMAATGEFFPGLVREMVAVGEATGHLDQVFADLATHFESQLKLRRSFLSAITWPIAQLGIAIVLVAVVIWVMGLLERNSGVRVDILGFGLVGTRGLVIYFALLAIAGGLIVAAIRCRSWTRSAEQWMDRVPYVGAALRTLALSRFAWSLEVTMDAGMEVRRALRLALQATHHWRFVEAAATVDAALSSGESVHDSLAASQAFPQEFLDILHIGEQSGTLAETMRRLSRQYQTEAQSSMAMLTKIAGHAVWALVALLIIVLIFRLASFYIGMINQAGAGML